MGKCIEAKDSRANFNKEYRVKEDVEAAKKEKLESNDKKEVPKNLRGSILKYEKTDFYRCPVNPVSPLQATEEIELVSMENMSSTDLLNVFLCTDF